MSLDPSDKNLVNRYLNGELSGMELESFRERMQLDDHFKNEVNFQNLLRSGIEMAKEEELRKRILDKIKFKKPRIPFALKLIVTFLIVTGIGISLWFYVGTDSSNPSNGSFFSGLNRKTKDKKADKKFSDAKSKAENDKSSSADSDKSGTRLGENGKDLQASSERLNDLAGDDKNQLAVNDSSVATGDDDRDIVIKKEKLLISASIPVIEKETSASKPASASPNNSLVHDAVEKLNPEAGVPDEEKPQTSYLVEFWVSPINYRGYKMSKNKLIIYGLEEPDALKLYRLNDAVFMKYGTEFFRLVNTYEYIPYQRMKESDVPLAIRQ